MVGMLDYLLMRRQQDQDAQNQQAMMAAMFSGTPQDQVNITPQISAAGPSAQALMMPSPQGPMPGGGVSPAMQGQGQPMGGNVSIPATATQPGQPMGGNNPQLALRAGAGMYNGPIAPMMQGPQADQLKALLSGLSPSAAMPVLSQILQNRFAPKAPMVAHEGDTFIQEGPNGQYGAVYTAPSKKPTFAEAPHTGINPATGKQDQFIIGNDGTQKWLSTAPGPKINFVNGQAVDENAVTPGTVIPQQAPQPTPPKSDAAFNQDKELARIRAENAIELKKTSVSPPFTDAQATLYAEQGLAGDKSVYTNVGRNQAGRTQIAQKMADLAASRGIKGADLAAINAAFAGDVRAQQVIGQRTGAIALSGEEARGVANLVKEAYAKLPRGEFKPFNELQALYANQTNSPEQGAAAAADFSLATTYARALNPQGIPRETDIAAVGKMINTNGDSYEKHAAVVDQILKEIDVISQSTGAARISQLNKIRIQHGLPPEAGGGIVAPTTNSKIDDLLKKYGPK